MLKISVTQAAANIVAYMKMKGYPFPDDDVFLFENPSDGQDSTAVTKDSLVQCESEKNNKQKTTK